MPLGETRTAITTTRPTQPLISIARSARLPWAFFSELIPPLRAYSCTHNKVNP